MFGFVGQISTLLSSLVDQTTGKPVTAGTIYIVARFAKSGHADDGKYWDGAAWSAAPSPWPTSTHLVGAMWSYPLPAGALVASMKGGKIDWEMTDNPTTPASSTTVSSSGCLDILAAIPATEADLINLDETLEEIAHAVVDEVITSGHVVPGSLALEVLSRAEPSGLREITIHVQDNVSAPVDGVDVAVYDSTNTTLLTRGTTNSSGNYVVHLDDGTYKARMAKALYSIALGTLVVTADATATFTAGPVVPIGTAEPGECLIYGTVRDAANSLVDGAVIDFTAETPQGVGDDVLSSGETSITTGPSAVHPAWTAGYFEVSLRRLARVRLSSTLSKLDNLVVTIPNAATSTLASLLRNILD